MNSNRGLVPLIILLAVGVPLGTWMAGPSPAPLPAVAGATRKASAPDREAPAKERGAPAHRVVTPPPSKERDPSQEGVQEVMLRGQQTGKPPRFVFATFPDPLENPSSRSFDEYLAAVRIAFESAGYSKFESWDPWFPSDGGTVEGQPWRSHPGVVLFRNSDGEQWALFLIGETPTRGVHYQALSEALDFWVATDSPDRGQGIIRILGPSNSGASRSLAITLKKWLEDHRSARVQRVEIVTGSATSGGNDDVFRGLAERLSAELVCQGQAAAELASPEGEPLAPPTISFEATVNDDDTLKAFVSSYLRDQLKISPAETAILTESSSTYGQGFAGPDPNQPHASRQPLVLRYPPYITSVRRGYANQGPGTPVPLATLDLDGEDDRSADLFSPHASLSRSMAGLSLSRMIHEISEEHIRAVEIAALDPEDAAFLANKVREAFPAVVVVVLSSDALYLRQRYAFDGLLVASTYPLSGRSQRTTFAFAGGDTRLPFPSEQAEGIFNATLVLLKNPMLLDYGPPLRIQEESQTPALWMSVVSNHELWPVEVRTRRDLVEARLVSESNYVHREPAASPAPIATPREAWRPSRAIGFDAFVLLFSLFSLACLASYWWARCLSPSPPPDAAPLLVRVLGRRSEHPQEILRALSLSLFLLVLAILWSFIAIIDWGGERRPSELASSFFSTLAGPVALGTLIAVWSALVHATCGLLRALRKPKRDGGAAEPKTWHDYLHLHLAGVAAAVGGGVAIVGFTWWSIYRWLGKCGFGQELVARTVDLRCQRFVLFFDRARLLGSGVSLMATTVVLAIGYFVWYAAHLYKVWLTHTFLPLRQLKMFPSAPDGPRKAVDDELGTAFKRFESIMPSALLWIAMAGVFTIALVRASGVPFFESVPYRWLTAFFYALFLAMLVFGSGRSLELWLRFRRLLRGTATATVLDECAKVPVELLGYLASAWDAQVAQAWLAAARGASVRVGAALADFITVDGKVSAPEWESYLADPPAEGAPGHEAAENGPGKALLRILYLWSGITYLRMHLLGFLRATSAGLLVLLMVVSMYPFRGERLLLGMVIVLGTLTATIVTVIFTQLGGDYVISRIGGKSKSVSWDPEFIRGLLLHAVLPLLGLLSLRFPGIGQTLGSFLGLLSGIAGKE